MERTESAQTGGGRGQWWTEGEGTRPRTWKNDPDTGATVWQLTVGVGGWPEGGTLRQL